MLAPLKTDARWTTFGLRALIVSTVATALFSVADAVVRGAEIGAGTGKYYFLTAITYDFRYFFEQAMFVAALIFVGGKFFETRTMVTIGFDKLDASNIALKGPDENNVVWVGHKYANALEAQAVSDATAERLKQSAA